MRARENRSAHEMLFGFAVGPEGIEPSTEGL
jgi:hypothetical protein